MRLKGTKMPETDRTDCISKVSLRKDPLVARGKILNLRITLQRKSLVEYRQSQSYQWDNKAAVNAKMNNPSSRVFEDNGHSGIPFCRYADCCDEEAGEVRVPGLFAFGERPVSPITTYYY